MPTHNPEITALMAQKGFRILEHEGHTTYERTRDGVTDIVCNASNDGCPALPRSMDAKAEWYRFPMDESPESPERVCRLADLLALL